MEVKEAIEFLENRYDYKPHRNSAYIISKYNEAIGVVCKNIEQGEKYRQMWNLLEADMEGQYCITPIEIYFKKNTINQQMKNIEQKHFPKEVSQDYSEGEE